MPMKKFEAFAIVLDEGNNSLEEFFFEFDLVVYHNKLSDVIKLLSCEEALKMLEDRKKVSRLDKKMDNQVAEFHRVCKELIIHQINTQILMLEKNRMEMVAFRKTLLL